jgi:hypothetical protein
VDAVRLIAERKIEEAIEEGAFKHLPAFGRIDCSLQGEAFFAHWWREKLERENLKGTESDR